MNSQTVKPSRSKVNLIVDSIIFFGFLIVSAPHFTGLAVHEWLGLAFGAGIVTHLVLHTRWIIETSRRIFGALPGKTRVNYILNVLLFVCMVTVAGSGILISEKALPAMGIVFTAGRAWRMVHVASANLVFLLVGLHVALHWRWIVDALKRFVFKPVISRIAPTPAHSTVPGRAKAIVPVYVDKR